MVPYVIKNNSDGTTNTCDIYTRLLDERIIFIDDEINNKTASNVIASLLHLSSLDESKEITIYINSPGGEVSSGLAIIDCMNFVKCDIKVIVVGMAASMAAVILSSGTKGKRFALKNSYIMIHSVRNNSTIGTLNDAKINMKHMEDINNKTMLILANNTNHKITTIERDTSRDRWFDSNEALKYGIIDRII